MVEIKREVSEQTSSEELKYEGAAIEDKPHDVAENLHAELAEQKEKYLRLYAEFENYKRMAQKEREELLNFANERLIKDLLPVIDNLELAVKHASGQESSRWIDSMKQGVENTLKEFFRILEKYGVKPIDSLGQPFNPEVHHAVTTIETDEKEENTVVQELRRGYYYKEKLLREPLVAVSKKPRPSEEGKVHLSGVENQ